jgi:uncharacterized protein YbaR (Trm112 family)
MLFICLTLRILLRQPEPSSNDSREAEVLNLARSEKRRAISLLSYNEPVIAPDLLEILACPVCRKPLVLRGEDSLKCNECKRLYPIRNGIPILLEPEATIEQL